MSTFFPWRRKGSRIIGSAAIAAGLFCAALTRADATELEAKNFPELVAARPDLAERDLVALLKSREAPLRQYAIVSLTEISPQSPDVIRAAIDALADESEPVRYQALAGLMRYSGRAPEALIAALMDFQNARPHRYWSAARNGGRELPVTTSTLIFTALYHARMDITDQLLDLYAREFSRLAEPDDFLHPYLTDSRPARGRSDDAFTRQLLANLEHEVAAAYRTRPQAAEVPHRLQEILDALSGKSASPMADRTAGVFPPEPPESYRARVTLAELQRLRSTSGSKAAVRQRLLDAIHFLSRHAAPRLAAAILSPDRHLRVAALGAVRLNKLSSPEIIAALEQSVVNAEPPYQEHAAQLLAQRGEEGRARLRALLAHPTGSVRAAALTYYPADATDLVSHVNKFLSSTDTTERAAALRHLALAAPPGCRETDSRRAPPAALAGLTAEGRLILTQMLERLDDVAELDSAIRVVSSMTCGDLPARRRIANQLALGLPRASSERLVRLANMLDRWSKEVHRLIDEPEAQRAIATAMARAATTEADYRSVSDLVRVFLSLDLPRNQARSLIPKVAETILVGDIRYWLGRWEIAKVMARHGVGHDFVEYVAQRAPVSGRAASDIYAALVPHAPSSSQFRAWQRKLLDSPDPVLAERVTVDIVKRDGAAPALFARLVGFVRNVKPSWRLESPAADQLLAMGRRGTLALTALVADVRIAEENRVALLRWVGENAERNKDIRDFLVRQARSGTPAAIRAAALEVLASFEATPPKFAELLLEAARSSDREVRLSAVSSWRHKKLPEKPMFDIAFADKDSEVQAAAVALLQSSAAAPERMLAAIRQALDRQDAVRRAAFGAMEALGDRAVPLLVELASRAGNLPAEYFATVERLDTLPADLEMALKKRADDPGAPNAAAAREVLDRFQLEEIRNAKGQGLSPGQLESLRLDLRSKDAQRRSRAASQLVANGADPWAEGGLIAAILMEAQVRKILGESLGTVLDWLDPPSGTLMSGPVNLLPVFPWPPPAGYSAYSIPRSLVTGRTFGEVYRSLVAALGAVSDNFEHGLFTGPTNGFAVVARLERVRADGTPYPEPGRWVKEGQPKLGLLDLLGDLFFSQPGYFRTIVFAVTSDLQPGKDPTRQLPEPGDGARDMPAALAAKPFGDDLYLLALVYSLERRPAGQIQPWIDGAPSAQHHLDRAGVLSHLPGAGRNRN